MIIGHIACGYLVGRVVCRRSRATGKTRRRLLLACVCGAVAPDVDMLWFYLVDDRQYHHHTYWTHYPVVWASLSAVSGWLLIAGAGPRHSLLAFAFALNGFVHMLLDTIVGDVWWLAPWVDRSFALFAVEPRYENWWLNFVFHWSFAVEIGLWAVACAAWRSGRRPQGTPIGGR